MRRRTKLITLAFCLNLILIAGYVRATSTSDNLTNSSTDATTTQADNTTGTQKSDTTSTQNNETTTETESTETETDETTTTYPVVTSINLTAGDVIGKVQWSTQGYAQKGFKVLWSKKSGLTYPLRSGDKYHYYSDPYYNADTLSAFDGSGNYYVRVCEYLGGSCGLYSNEITISFEGEAVITKVSPNEGAPWTKITIYGKNLQSSCAGKSDCKSGIKFGDYYLSHENFSNYSVNWTDTKITLSLPEEAMSGIIRISRNFVQSSHTESFDISGPNFTVLQEADSCTTEYTPVCGQLPIACFGEPCDPITKTFDNMCQLERETGVAFLYNGGCESDKPAPPSVKETIKCVFRGPEGNKQQKCYWSEYSCQSNVINGHGECTIDIKGQRGEKMVWKSSCGGYADTVLDGQNNVADFFCDKAEAKICSREYMPVCGVDGRTYPNKCMAMEHHNVKIEYHGECRRDDYRDRDGYEGGYEKSYKHAKWQCANGTVEEWGDDTSCKRQADWKEYAIESCGQNELIDLKVFDVCGIDKDLININNKAKNLVDNKLDSILSELKELRSIVREQKSQIKYLKSLVHDMGKIAQTMQDSIKNFVTYGVDDNTKKLGEGERAAVIHSYKSAFDKLPENEDELADAIKIANGRWPSITNAKAENKAKDKFTEIYKRAANMDNPRDNAAVTIMAYGLRQKAQNRKLESEKVGIKTFKHIFGHHPASTDDWNTMQAITYSGATR